MKQYNITIVLILTSVLGFSQSKILTKEEIRKYYFEKTGGLSSRQWHTCNNDSVFYKSDTLNLYEYSAPDCKEFITLSFNKPAEFCLHKGLRTAGPTIMYPATEDDHYKMEIIEDKELRYLKITQKRKTIYLFRILEIGFNQEEKRQKIELVRVVE